MHKNRKISFLLSARPSPGGERAARRVRAELPVSRCLAEEDQGEVSPIFPQPRSHRGHEVDSSQTSYHQPDRNVSADGQLTLA